MKNKKEFDRICYLLLHTKSFTVDGEVKEMLFKLMDELNELNEKNKKLHNMIKEIDYIINEDEDYEEI